MILYVYVIILIFMLQELNHQATIVPDLNVKELELNAPFPRKVIKWWQWYHKLTGLDMVEAAKLQINDIHDKVFECQNEKRILNQQMIDITHKLREISSELIQTKRDDLKHVHLTKIEYENLQKQNKILEQLTLLDIEEKDNFTQLTTAYKEYQDRQNLNAQKYKYLSILVSALAAIVSLIGSMIFNNKKIRDIQNTISNAQKKTESLLDTNANQLSNLQKILNSFETKFSQSIINTHKGKETGNDNTSNILVTCAKYTAYSLVSGVSYVKRGIYVCGSYVVKIFY